MLKIWNISICTTEAARKGSGYDFVFMTNERLEASCKKELDELI